MTFAPKKPCSVHANLLESLRPDYQAIFQSWMAAKSTKSGLPKDFSHLEHN